MSSEVQASRVLEPWKAAIAAAVKAPDELIDLLGLPDSLRPGARAAARQFPLLVPRAFLARMRPGDPGDPLLRQVLPLGEEAVPVPGHSRDPVGDRAATVAPGLIQKYAGRVLLVAGTTCAVHCRYCFRRHFPYEEALRDIDASSPALQHIAADPTIREVILSGGDPLTLGDACLESLVHALASIPHLERLRVHSRLPVVIPERVTQALIRWLRGTRLAPVLVVQVNHPAELEGDCAVALGRLVDAGVPVLSQSVLLRGVNDEVDTIVRLSERLIALRVMPYYLHQIDRVDGAAHFEVDEARGIEIIAEAARRLPGYAVPRYVKEAAGAPAKLRVENL